MCCPLKYRFQYVEELPKPFKPSGLAFGGAIHAAIEWYHKANRQGVKPPLEKVQKIFQADWYAQRTDSEIRYKDKETEEQLITKGNELLSLYYSVPLVNGVRATEYAFEVPIVNLKTDEILTLPLKGRIDLIEEGDAIGEIKTSSKKLDKHTLDNQLQLTAYGYAYRLLFGRFPKAYRVINLVKTKAPKIEALQTERKE